MKPQIHIGWLIFFGLLLIVLGYFIHDWFYVPSETVTIKSKKDYDIVTFKLPNSRDPEVFGSSYWESFHTLSNMIPCSACRYKAVPFMKFFHDIVNKNTGKKIFDQENYNYWIEYIKKMDVKK